MSRMPKWNRRQRAFAVGLFSLIVLIVILAAAAWMKPELLATHLDSRNEPPSWSNLFGTDWLGRDMFVRTIEGLAISIKVGFVGAASSTVIAVVLTMIASTMGRVADRIVSWLIDLFLSVPHLVMLILIAFISGGGFQGVVIGVAVTHWPSLARLLRAEAMALKQAEFVQLAKHFGRSRSWIAFRHLMPHLLPQVLVGFLLLFPHAILHESAITFLGLGLSPHEPAIGIILSESMRYLSTGMWWLAVFPGLGLLFMVRAFDLLGDSLRHWIHPVRSQE